MRTITFIILTLAIVAFSRWQGLSWRISLMMVTVIIILGVVLKRKGKQRGHGIETAINRLPHVEHDSWWAGRINQLRSGVAGHSATDEVMNDYELRRGFQRSTPLTQEEYKNFTHPQNYYGTPPTYEQYRELWERYQREQPKSESYEHYRYERF